MVPEGKVISFEPNPPRYAQSLFKRTKDSITQRYISPFALGEKNGIFTFYVCYGAQYDPI